jgi:type IV pilus assembly protein PilE
LDGAAQVQTIGNMSSHILTLQRRGAPASRGFTIIELMIVVIVLGVLSAVALPSFLDSVRKGRRTEAFAAIATIQQAQERWRSNNPAYASSLSNLVVTTPTRPGGYYTLAVSAGSTTSSPTDTDVAYIATASAASGTSQANDGDCAKLSVQVVRGNISYGSCASCSTFTYTNTNKCWAK